MVVLLCYWFKLLYLHAGLRTEDSPGHDGFVEFKRFAAAERCLGDDAEIVDLVLGQIGDAERCHVRRTHSHLHTSTNQSISRSVSHTGVDKGSPGGPAPSVARQKRKEGGISIRCPTCILV